MECPTGVFNLIKHFLSFIRKVIMEKIYFYIIILIPFLFVYLLAQTNYNENIFLFN